MGFNFCWSSDGIMDLALPANPEQQPQLWRANQPIRFHHLLGNKSKCGGGSRYGFGKSHLVPGANKYSDERLVLFQRPAVDELSDAFLPHSVALRGHSVTRQCTE